MRKSRLPLIAILCLILSGCTRPVSYSKAVMIMDTLVRITVADHMDTGSMERAYDSAVDRMRTLAARFDYFNPGSELSRMNALKRGESLRVSDEMAALLDMSQALSDKTGGAFDVTVAPLADLWLLPRDGAHRLPDESEVERALDRVGPGAWSVDGRRNTVTAEKYGARINLGGVAKGFIVDRAIEVLASAGVTNALIDAGGDLYCMGNGTGRGWRIGIRDPRHRQRIIATLYLSGRAIATSGGYERSITVGTRTITHVIDPRTGYPVENPLKSVTVIENSCARADALATALYVMSPEEGRAVIESIEGAECIIIDGDDRVYASSGCDQFDLQLKSRAFRLPLTSNKSPKSYAEY
jgi:thiamine biosynthesis lipoprotein